MKIIHLLTFAWLIQGLIPSFAENIVEEDHWVMPGQRVGVAVLGMTEKEATQKVGNHDGEYALPNGFKAEFSEWKEPDKVSTLRMFYDRAGHLVQISAETWGVATKDGISIKSTLADIQKKYIHLEHSSFTTKDADIECYTDKAKGITFAFRNSDSHPYALIVHHTNAAVIPDINQKPVKQ